MFIREGEGRRGRLRGERHSEIMGVGVIGVGGVCGLGSGSVWIGVIM
mgnify:CR=1 FL=1